MSHVLIMTQLIDRVLQNAAPTKAATTKKAPVAKKAAPPTAKKPAAKKAAPAAAKKTGDAAKAKKSTTAKTTVKKVSEWKSVGWSYSTHYCTRPLRRRPLRSPKLSLRLPQSRRPEAFLLPHTLFMLVGSCIGKIPTGVVTLHFSLDGRLVMCISVT